jgi:hypothetical protein
MAKTDVAADEAHEAEEASVVVEANEAHNAEADEAAKAIVANGAHEASETDSAILTNKAVEAIKVNDISHTKYYSLSELYFGI